MIAAKAAVAIGPKEDSAQTNGPRISAVFHELSVDRSDFHFAAF